MRKKYKKIIIFFLALVIFWDSAGIAFAKTKEELLRDLEKIAKEQESFIQNIANFQGQSSEAMASLGSAQNQILVNKKELEELEQNIKEATVILDQTKEQKDTLLRRFYINRSGSIGYLALLSAESLNDLIRNQIYIHSAQEKIVTEIKKIDEEKKILEQGIVIAQTRREVLLSQIDIWQNQLASLRASIIEEENKIKDLEKNRREVEQQILALDPPPIPKANNSPVINLNVVDFSLQNTITIAGAGTPHGLGMSQYGANAMAKNGKDFEDILTHYYQGTYLKQANTDGIDIKVKLSASPGGGAIIVASGSVKNESTGEILSAGAIVSAVPGLVLSPQDATSRLTVTYKYNSFNIYRGQINVIGSPGRLVTYNILPLEDYLRGVVPGEMPASWQKEALKAQAVAARNYAYKNREICDTPSCQVYHGALKEVASTNQAIEETRGQLLFYGSEIITAYYFSTSGGWTENNENVWGGTPRSWLRGVESPGEEDSPHYRWQAKTLDKATLENYLNSDPDTAVGNVEKIEITKRGVSGLVMAVKITGSSGTKLVTGQNFKYVINVNLPDGTQDYVKSGLFGIR